MELLKRREKERKERREELRLQVRRILKEALHRLVPGERVLLFGSVTQPYGFHQRSDVDIAFLEEPKNDLTLKEHKITPLLDAADRAAALVPATCEKFFSRIADSIRKN